jgi:SAM-dependent methyltransferase
VARPRRKEHLTVDIKKTVRKAYADVARGKRRSCCGPESACCAEDSARRLGYSPDEVAGVPEGANMGLGCGNPTAIAELQPGETVLDLGSGGGFDCFLAAARVGPAGRVVGVDMTPEMIEKARANAERAGAGNVEFRLGEIEAIPLDDASADVVISNCVINLSPDKARVFREIARVLKPGGRMMVSDIVLTGPLPDALRGDAAAISACIGNAVAKDDYLVLIGAAGLTGITTRSLADASEMLGEAGCCDAPVDPEALRGVVASLTVSAVKP